MRYVKQEDFEAYQKQVDERLKKLESPDKPKANKKQDNKADAVKS